MNKLFIITFFLLFLYTSDTEAHSGRTNSSGCHNCYTGSCEGTYHCHNGGEYNPPPSPPSPTFPLSIKANIEYVPNNDGESFNIKVELLDDVPTRYSAVLNTQCAGCDPGSSVDFYTSDLLFENRFTGRTYLNVKKEINGVWSSTTYWTLDIPEWYPPPTQTPSPMPPSPTISIKSNNTSTLSIDEIVISIFFGFTGYIFFKLFRK